MILKSFCDLCGVSTNDNLEYVFLNKDSSRIYNNEIVINNDIRNGIELLLMSVHR